jgi:antitoxin MazE
VGALRLKAGDEIDVRIAGGHVLAVERKPSRQDYLDRLRAYRGRLPSDFKFNRDEANDS